MSSTNDERLISNFKNKRRMEHCLSDNQPSGYDNSLNKPSYFKYIFIRNMLIHKYMDCIKSSDIVANINTNQIRGIMSMYASKLSELSKNSNYKYKPVDNSDPIKARIQALNEYMKAKASFNVTEVKLDPKIYPKRSKIDLAKLKERLDTTGMEGTSLRKLAAEYNVSTMLMHKVVKQNLKYRHKSVYPLNVKAINQPSMNATLIYYIRHYFLLEDDHFFIYVDESSFNNHKRSKKRWVQKSKKAWCYDFGRLKSISLILAVSKLGPVVFTLKKGYYTGVDFSKFIKELNRKLEVDPEYKDMYESNKIVIILDNARTHKTKEVKEAMMELKCKVLFLPPYSPHLNPIENVFNFIKRRYYDMTFCNT